VPLLRGWHDPAEWTGPTIQKGPFVGLLAAWSFGSSVLTAIRQWRIIRISGTDRDLYLHEADRRSAKR
jgi:hypothetical protein